MDKSYLKGLNTLRFFAAFFVVISHGQISIVKIGFENFNTLAIFNRGGDAVEFFFVLSGFLITYLLQKEIAKTGRVSINHFYLRRVFRIWPLYFLVVLIGFVFLGYLLPNLTGEVFFKFPYLKGLSLFLFFLPNLVTTMYPTGMLYPLWSIGVEEQYYLFWAPLVNLFRKRLPVVILVFFVLTYIWYGLLLKGMIPVSDIAVHFLKTQKFYAMATGAMFGLVFYKYTVQYQLSFLASKTMQWVVFALIGYYYLIGPLPYIQGIFGCLFFAVLYGLLIINTSLLPRPVINLEKKPFIYLGTISYGLYMFHMMVDYVLRFTVMHFHMQRLGIAVLLPVYHILLLGGAIGVAAFSHKYYESFFLKLKDQPFRLRLKERYA